MRGPGSAERLPHVGGLVVAVVMVADWQPPAEAAIVKGIMEIVSGVLQVPMSTLAGTFNGPPLVGTILGAANGLITGTGLVAHGALELGVSAVSIAKTVAPYVLPFVF